MIVASDNFDRADNVLSVSSPDWSVVQTGFPECKIVSHQVKAFSQSSIASVDCFVGLAVMGDQFSQFTVITAPTALSRTNLVLRATPGSAEVAAFYYIDFDTLGSTIYFNYILPSGGGSFGSLSPFGGILDGDVLRAEIVGYTCYVYQNGTLLGSVVDTGARISSGVPGIHLLFKIAGTDPVIDDWSGGSLLTGPFPTSLQDLL